MNSRDSKSVGSFYPPHFYPHSIVMVCLGYIFKQYFKQNLKCPQVYMGTLDLAARAVPAVTEQSKEREEEEEDKKRE